jgi:hypothetical protein
MTEEEGMEKEMRMVDGDQGTGVREQGLGSWSTRLGLGRMEGKGLVIGD